MQILVGALNFYKKRSDLFGDIAILLFFAVCLFFFSIGNYYNSDEGVILNGAWRMYQGDKLYTDFFSFIAPGSFWWTELSFHLLGPTYFSARIFSVFLLAISVIAVYWTTMLVGGSRFAAFFASLVWFLGNILFGVTINHNNHSSYLASIALLFIVLALSKNSSAYFFASGLFIGITAVFLQTKGLALAGGLILPASVFAATGKIRAAYFLVLCGGFFAVVATMFCFWDPTFLYETLIRWPQEHYMVANKISKIGWLMVLAVFLAVFYAVIRAKNVSGGRIVFLLGVSQFFLLLSALTRPDTIHLFLASFGLIVFGALAIDKYLPSFSNFFRISRRIFENLTLSVLVLAVFIFSLANGLEALRRERYFENSIIQSRRFDNLYAHPFMPGIYFELGLANPYPYDVLLTGMYPEEAFSENLSKLKSENPEYIFVDYGMASKFGYDTANALDSYISENYETANIIDTFQILKRK